LQSRPIVQRRVHGVNFIRVRDSCAGGQPFSGGKELPTGPLTAFAVLEIRGPKLRHSAPLNVSRVTSSAPSSSVKHLALDESDEDLLADATRDSEGRLTGMRFSWKKRGDKKHAGWDNTVLGWIEIDGTRLIAEVNSEARADAIRKKIETALGAVIRYRASEIQSLEQMFADERADGSARGGAASEESERFAELPEVREKISEMMAAHWEHWVSQPLPILGNRTPMDAVKDPDGREIVESLVLQGERLGRSPNLQTDGNVFRRLRGRLGLAEGGSTTGASTIG
jgi:hypothetical protein